ncbi:carbohydrate-binding family 9-like protein [Paenibacillaceae bacterium]|nr:carbohydrate-binding family 9-like protein [Paenibacillaceae bacterium]
MNRNAVEEPALPFSPLQYVCKKAPHPLVLDGRLDKPFWQDAAWTDDFVDIEGELKPLPAKRTRVKMLWDEQYFYFGAEMEENEIWATLTERDSVIFQDNDFEIFIDPDGDTHNYYEFEINALNTVWDLLLVKPYRDGGPCVNGWDISGLQTAVHIDGTLNDPSVPSRAWSVEVAIPWKILRECAPDNRPPLPGEFWRVNFSRVQWQVEVQDGAYTKKINPESGKPFPEDNWVWSPMGIINMHYPELWGYVWFADGQDQPDQQLPADEYTKWELRKLYYRQRNYYAAHGCFAGKLSQLTADDQWQSQPEIETTSRLFQASAPSSDGITRLYIREDGKLWRE